MSPISQSKCLKTLQWLILFWVFMYGRSVQAATPIVITGVDSALKDNIELYLETHAMTCNNNDDDIESFIRSVPKKVKKAVRPFGYYDPLMAMKRTDSDNCWSIEIIVEPGEQVKVRKLELKLTGAGANTEPFVQLLQNKPFQIGQAINDNEYELYKSKLINAASEQGYLDAKFITQIIDVYPEQLAADITLFFDTGNRYKLASLEINQAPEILNIEFIKSMIPLKAGQLFSQADLNAVRKKLQATGYFKRIQINLDVEQRTNGEVPIQFELTPADRIKYSVGLGFSTDTGPRVSLDYTNSRIGQFGYKFNAKTSFSEVISETGLGIQIPSKDRPVNKWFQVNFGHRHEHTDATNSDALKLGISQTRIKDSKWQNINYLDWVDETFEIGKNQSKSTMFVAGTSWSYIKADSPTQPSRGYRLQAELKGALDNVVSDTSFAQAAFSYKGIQSVGERNRFIYRAEVGTTWVDDFTSLPSSYRFYTGGDQSIRGFDYETLAPIDSEQNVIGGRHKVVASIEYERLISGPWAWATFIDAGNAFTNDFKIEKSVGIGLRWFSPVGSVRLDLGFPIDHEDQTFRFHITIGPDL